ncbi:MAG: YitT family protein [Lachnospiraceae bacterium]|nr:YitT family protein [Lachnospiraceae bacterium]
MKRRTPAVEYFYLILGSFLIGFAIKNIYDPVNLVTGGLSGLAIIFKDQFHVPLWVTNTALNIPLFLASYWMKGWRFIKRTLVSTVALSVSLYIIPEMTLFPAEDLFLVSLFGGILVGVGTGLVLLPQATTGGTDMLAVLIQKKIPQYTVPQVLQVLDAAIVIAGAAVFGVRPALYALIAIYACAQVSDGILEGLKFSKMVYIISGKNREIADTIITEMNRSATELSGRGMYTGEDKNMLCCVVSKKEISQLKEIVRKFDKRAFVIVSDVREVLGEGFIEY